ncbi:DNA-binding protein [Hymenobacter sp. H14-R3]|uniref:DNA-binding protein n=1 Tax=Hymenobacter sp. H14-R3 TaxID=3046308 RepID=UPI0024BBBEBA|nr:DNA-binding protein [Hymenobacter sp. H14-R3]MDJ0367993.1 DNA-binding protein [Hymenobacter sp. H14-R3]
MEDTATFLTIKQAAQQVNKSEQTIRRLVKQHAKTSHIQVEQTPKGNTYLISQTFLAQQYPSQAEPLPAVIAQAQVPEVAELQRQLAERDQTIQQLQNRLLEQNDVLNALTSQVNSQRIGRIEELLLSQNEQLGELQKRLPEPAKVLQLPSAPEPEKKSLWQRLFGS